MDGHQRLPSYGSRVRGCLLGGAVGDALGNPVEFMSLAQIRSEFGPAGLTDMIKTDVTDDTQMTLFTAEGLIRARLHGGDAVTSVHRAYLRWFDTQNRPVPAPQDGGFRTGWLRTQEWLYARRAPGNACLSGLRSRITPRPPGSPLGHGPINPDSKGCGTVMRSAPFGLLRGPRATGPHPADDPVTLAIATARLTHGHPTAAIASGALAHLVDRLVQGDSLAEAAASTESMLSAFDGQGAEHRETGDALRAARRLAGAGEPTAEKVESLGEGWIAEEALAVALYCALAEPDPRAALLLAVNHSGDADSTGAICGNIIGAAYGEAALPADWAHAVEGRETILQLADDLAAVSGLAARHPSD
ncbi:ADP-ribosylglycohydrolase family protein [Planomonospora sp. ID67723]|uniref:ADP-ribosylglycohydrolase family protein n=1 Tax=Planomonospora sp. ID67723 TaxID=2738134 RepID=UPI0018C43167|nr:ADP-ribosylglycohydrolase family protein [Planomonospora sp. ID67723]MBG0832871.1 ADP-ribosylglycohydrolase family protein [Planomonospora sp. ID67723]